MGLDLSKLGTTRAEDAQGTPTQSHISPIIPLDEDNGKVFVYDFLLPDSTARGRLLLARASGWFHLDTGAPRS